MKVHFIAIGGSAMHNLAIALHKKGYEITGSDDEIFEPAKSRLNKYGLLPAKEGWDISKVHAGLDAVILGMHAKADNPELAEAKKLHLKIYSYPEYIYEQSKDKTRIVIGGSHGKTTITAMILHVLNEYKVATDYMLGAMLEGFEVMVKLSNDAKYIILEGDEYLSSADDPRPKFHLYKPDIGLLSGIAWDHINVFKTFGSYLEQFKIFINLISTNGLLIYNYEDFNVRQIAEDCTHNINKLPYKLPKYEIKDGITYIEYNNKKYPLIVFGKHNLSNINAARLVCNQIGIKDEQFYNSIGTFKGASKRLELMGSSSSSGSGSGSSSGSKKMCSVYTDFAHSPSKLKATVEAVKEQYPDQKLVACLELHTYSSLSKDFLPQYKGAMDKADTAIVYFNPHAIKLKKLADINSDQIKEGFGYGNLIVFNDSELLNKYLLSLKWEKMNLLMMSSGDFDGINLKQLVQKISV